MTRRSVFTIIFNKEEATSARFFCPLSGLSWTSGRRSSFENSLADKFIGNCNKSFVNRGRLKILHLCGWKKTNMYLSISTSIFHNSTYTRSAQNNRKTRASPARWKKTFTAAFKLRNYVITGGGVLFVRKSGYRAAYIYFTRCEPSAARLW